MKFLKLFESLGGNYNIPTYGELNDMIESGKVDVTDRVDSPDYHNEGDVDTQICQASDIKDLGHEYHDYSWVLHPKNLKLKKGQFPNIYFALFEDGEVVANYLMLNGFYLFGDVLVLYSPTICKFINLMLNKSVESRTKDLIDNPVYLEGGEYEFKYEERYDREEGTFVNLLVCTKKSSSEVVEIEIIKKPIWNTMTEPYAKYKLSEDDSLNESVGNVYLPTEKEIRAGINNGSIKTCKQYGSKPDLKYTLRERWTPVQDLGHDYHNYQWSTFRDDRGSRINFFGLFEDGSLVCVFPIEFREDPRITTTTKYRGFFRIDDILLFFTDDGVRYIVNLNTNQPEFVGHLSEFSAEGGEYKFEYSRWNGVLICKKMSEREEYHYQVPVTSWEIDMKFKNYGQGKLIRFVEF